MQLKRMVPAVALAVPVLAAVVTVFAPSGARAATNKFDAAMQPIVTAYLKVTAALVADKTDGVAAAAGDMEKHAAQLDPATVTGEHAAHFKDLPVKIREQAAALGKAKDLAAARDVLRELTKPLAMWVAMAKPGTVNVVFCSMAKGSWLQQGKEIKNPYYGPKMLNCGEIVDGPDAGKKGGHMEGGAAPDAGHGEHKH